MNGSKLLGIAAVVLFAVALVLTFVHGSDPKTISELTLGGLVCFAGAHVT